VYTFLVIIHLIVCFFLISIVLLQSGKGAQMGATFGGSGQTLFGSRGTATILNKITTISAIVFMLTSFGLTYFATLGDNIDLPEGKIQKSSETPPIAEQPQPKAEQGSEEPAPPQAVQDEGQEQKGSEEAAPPQAVQDKKQGEKEQPGTSAEEQKAEPTTAPAGTVQDEVQDKQEPIEPAQEQKTEQP
jgi:preprotein translocase subunit SecG